MNPVPISVEGELIARYGARNVGKPACGVISVSGRNPVKLGEGREPSVLVVCIGCLLSQPVGDSCKAVCGVVGVCDRSAIRVRDLCDVSGGVVDVGKGETVGVGESRDPAVGVIAEGTCPEGILHLGQSVEIVISICHLSLVGIGDAGKLPGRGVGVSQRGPVSVRAVCKPSVDGIGTDRCL